MRPFQRFFELASERTKGQIKITCDRLEALNLGLTSTSVKGMYTAPEMNSKSQMETIVINTELSQLYAVSVLFHELAHATGTKDRLDRKGVTNNEAYACIPMVKGIEEVIAESTALRLMKHFGLATDETTKKSEKYVAVYQIYIPERYRSDVLPSHYAEFWLSESDIDAEIEKAFQYVLTHWCPDASMLETELKNKLHDFYRF